LHGSLRSSWITFDNAILLNYTNYR